MNSPYVILGVQPDATDAEITKAYRRLAKRFHSDRNPGNDDAKARYAAVDAAYKLLSDPVRRELYDRTGDDSEPRHSTHDPAHAELCQLLQPLLIEVLQGLSSSTFTSPAQAVKNTDVVAAIKGKLASMTVRAETHKDSVKRGCETLKVVVDRFEVKEGVNVLQDIARAQLAAIEAELIRVTAEIAKFGRAKAHLDGASYRKDGASGRDHTLSGIRMITWRTS